MSSSATESSSPRWLLPLLILLFFGSGACALVYQVMWLRLLALVFGVTVYAASTVLAGFMAGLAVGSALAGRYARTLTRPLAAFGVVEILVGATALATPLALDVLTRIWIAIHPALPESLAVITLLRFVCAFAVLIVPTSLMGATLPLVVKSAVARQPRIGGRIGLLYAINTTGAIVGALVAGFYLISDVGVSLSFRLAAATNLVIGLTAIAAARALPGTGSREPGAGNREPNAQSPEPEAASREAASSEPGATRGEAQRRAVLVTFALSGAMSLALEIIWFRMLAVLLRPTAYAFTIMLAAVLAGIALGSAVVTPLLRRRWPWLPILTAIQAAIAIAAVLSFNTLASADGLNNLVTAAVGSAGFDTYLVPIIATSLAAMLPATVLLGAAFPIGLALWAGDDPGPETSRRVGVFYSLNVCGAIAGSTLAGFVLLPWLGSAGSLTAAAALALGSAVWLALVQWRERPNFAGFVALVAPVAFVMAALNAVDPFEIQQQRSRLRETVLWRKEGVQTTVAIHEGPGDRRARRIMYLDGMHQANDSDATAFIHQRIGALPMLLHPDPKTALVVGLGGGATPGALSTFGADVDVVELSDAVAEGSRFFAHINFNLLERPNVRLRVDDGRNYLLMTRKKYDVITADIILPRHAGAGALYSREYYMLVRRALAEGGVAMQWIDSETEVEYKLLMRTFLSVFPETTLWGDGTLMLGSLTPFTLSASNFERRRQDPRFRTAFDWDLETIRRLYVAGPASLRAYAGDGEILTDDKPRIEYFLSLPRNSPPAMLEGVQGRFEDVLRP